MDYTASRLTERELAEARSILAALSLLVCGDGPLLQVHDALAPIRAAAYADGYAAGKSASAS